MLPLPLYYALLLLCWVYALFKGGSPERVGASIIGVGSILSLALVSGPARSFGSVEVGVFLVDVAALVAFLILAIRAERYWPLWIAALQLIGTAAHAVKLADPEVIRRAYAVALVLWSYPMLLLIALGTWRHQQRLKLNGTDRSWTISSAPSAAAGGPKS